jgi:hypothetical protein
MSMYRHPGVTTLAAGISRERTTVTTRLWNARMEAAKAAGVGDQCPSTKPQSALHAKPPHKTSIRYAFENDEDLKEAYRNPWNGVRIGRIVEGVVVMYFYVFESLAALVVHPPLPPLRPQPTNGA